MYNYVRHGRGRLINFILGPVGYPISQKCIAIPMFTMPVKITYIFQ